MAVLAIAKTIPGLITSIFGNISSVFSPDLTKLYAEDKLEDFKNAINNSIKILGIIVNIPIAGLIVFGQQFYKLWVPTQDYNQIHILSVLTVMCLVLSGSTVTIYSIFSITNKIKTNAIVTLSLGLVSTAIVFVLIRTTGFGVYAVAGVSTSLAILKNLIFVFPYAAKCINAKWYTFYIPAFRGVFCCFLTIGICYIFKAVIPVDSWVSLFSAGALSGLTGFIANSFIVLKKSERKMLFDKVSKKLLRQKA